MQQLWHITRFYVRQSELAIYSMCFLHLLGTDPTCYFISYSQCSNIYMCVFRIKNYINLQTSYYRFTDPAALDSNVRLTEMKV